MTAAEGLGRYLTTLRQRWRMVATIVLIGGLTGFIVASELPKTWHATTKVLMDQHRPVEAILGTAGFQSDPERELNTGVELVKVEPVAEAVRHSLGLREDDATVLGKISADLDSNSSVMSITASDKSAGRAARLANAFALEYRDFRARSAQEAVRGAVASARARLNRLPPGPQRDDLAAQVRRVEATEAFQTGGVQIVRRADAANASGSPRPLVSGIVGGLLGAVVAAVAIVVLTRTDRRVGGDGDIEEATGRPVLARIPAAPAEAHDALVTLAMSLTQARNGAPPPAVLLVASPGPGEGTVDVTLGLTRALATLGRRAIAIEANFRRPAYARRLDVRRRTGLAQVLTGFSELERELEPLDGGGAVLPAGVPALPPQRLLTDDAMVAVVEEAMGQADVVLLSVPPIAQVGDGLALAPLVDASLLVARLDVTRLDGLRQATRVLTDAGAAPIGVVATGRPAGDGFDAALGRLRGGRSRAETAPSEAPTRAPGTATEATTG